ncbi:LIC_10190 family membrane protein [Flavobacterium wongokense]|uniref:LIC_10190 family membrane protein n=1 Tax=Flavobacterium wongokense TaxID=2910674 RepID=UPI001F3A037E|nr:hypothetical protein [Flavobacterium sp. WG47]MCF6132165.1 hypothetical protein [Flavobacterium sp. WG47]
MILILFSWLYIFFTTVTFGIAFSKALRILQLDTVITTILGLFSVTIMASVWAFFGPINMGFHIVLLLLSIIFWYQNKAAFLSILQSILRQVKLFSFPIRILLIVSSLLILAQSATLPFIIDNESYYIQTIKWLNEYGFVKGLANLHLFLGQNSGWHITQSVYNLSFLYDRFNDLNGFCLLLANFFAFQKLHSYFTKGNPTDLIFGLLPLSYVFLFQFVSAPSPDLPVYIFGFVLFSVYLQNDNLKDRFVIISILSLFVVFIKVTAVVLFLFPIVLLINNFKAVQKQVFTIGAIGALVLIVFVSKNTMLTGYPLFPLLCFRIDAFDYTVPAIIMDFFFSKSMLQSFFIPNEAYGIMTFSDMVKKYLFNNGLTGYIGLVSILMLLISPIIIIRKQLSKSIWTIYAAFLILAVLLCLSSLQYRFYVYFTLFFLLLLISLWLSNPKWIIRFYILSTVLIMIVVFVPMSFGNLTTNKYLSQNTTFHFKNILIPEPNSKWRPEYRGGSVGNMHYHSPIDNSFFWVTGNGQLPCINTLQLDYFHKGFFYIPQQRSIDLSDGFYAQKVSGDE